MLDRAMKMLSHKLSTLYFLVLGVYFRRSSLFTVGSIPLVDSVFLCFPHAFEYTRISLDVKFIATRCR